ncbi:MAG: DUF2079 domain-containing protein [Deltaproteobacteria bacterium]|nr:DUF2079 domain-containing protein [Deltaproteobacteria bacterium]
MNRTAPDTNIPTTTDGPSGNSPGDWRCRWGDRDWDGRAVMAAALLAYFLVVTGVNLALFDAGLFIKQDDHMNLHMVLENILEGRAALQAQVNGNLIGTDDHFTPTFLLLLPLYALYPHPAMLMIALGLLVTASAWMVMLMGRAVGGTTFGVKAGLVCLILPWTIAQATSGLWQPSLALVAVPLAVWAYVRERYAAFVVALIMLLGVQEDLMLLAGPLALLPLADRRGAKWIAAPVVLTAAWAALLVLGTRNFGGGRSLEQVLPVIVDSANVGVLLGLLALGLAAWRIRPRLLWPWFAVAAPSLMVAYQFVGAHLPAFPYDKSAHYFVASMTWLTCGAVVELGRAKTRGAALPKGQLVGAAVVLAIFAATSYPTAADTWKRAANDYRRISKVDVDAMVAALPEGARVATDLPISYLLEPKAEAIIEFGKEGEAFVINEHFLDWDVLRDVDEPYLAHQLRRARQRLGGVIVVEETEPGKSRVLDRVFAPDPTGLAILEDTLFLGLVAPTNPDRSWGEVWIFDLTTNPMRRRRRVEISQTPDGPRFHGALRLVPGNASDEACVCEATSAGVCLRATGEILRDDKEICAHSTFETSIDDGIHPELGSLTDVESGDVDGDGERETLFGHAASMAVNVVESDGTSRLLPTGPFARSIGVYDINRDGKDEVFATLTNVVGDCRDFIAYLKSQKFEQIILPDGRVVPATFDYCDAPPTPTESSR